MSDDAIRVFYSVSPAPTQLVSAQYPMFLLGPTVACLNEGKLDMQKQATHVAVFGERLDYVQGKRRVFVHSAGGDYFDPVEMEHDVERFFSLDHGLAACLYTLTKGDGRPYQRLVFVRGAGYGEDEEDDQWEGEWESLGINLPACETVLGVQMLGRKVVVVAKQQGEILAFEVLPSKEDDDELARTPVSELPRHFHENAARAGFVALDTGSIVSGFVVTEDERCTTVHLEGKQEHTIQVPAPDCVAISGDEILAVTMDGEVLSFSGRGLKVLAKLGLVHGTPTHICGEGADIAVATEKGLYHFEKDDKTTESAEFKHVDLTGSVAEEKKAPAPAPAPAAPAEASDDEDSDVVEQPRPKPKARKAPKAPEGAKKPRAKKAKAKTIEQLTAEAEEAKEAAKRAEAKLEAAKAAEGKVACALKEARLLTRQIRRRKYTLEGKVKTFDQKLEELRRKRADEAAEVAKLEKEEKAVAEVIKNLRKQVQQKD